MVGYKLRIPPVHESGRRRILVGLVVLTVMGGGAGCAETRKHPDSSARSAIAATVPAGITRTVQLGDRPFKLHVPKKYDPGRAASLVVALHGFGADADRMASRLGLTAASEERAFLLALPDGTKDSDGLQFWNATDACCNVEGADVDDSRYLSDVIDAVSDAYAVDRARVFVIGISNGGFMAHRLACDHADQLASIVSLAGAQSADPAACNPTRAVSVLEVHGSEDDTVLFEGGRSQGHRYPSVAETVSDWRRLDGCDDRPGTKGARLDVDVALPGAETVPTSWSTGCAHSTEVALWKVYGGGHVPDFGPGFTSDILDWLDTHARMAG